MSKGMNRGKFPWKSVTFAVIYTAGASASVVFHPLGGVTILTMLVVLAFAVARFVYWYKRGRFGAKSHIARLERKQERSDGSMSRWDHTRHFSRVAMLKTWAGPLQPECDETGMIATWRGGIGLIAWSPGFSNYGDMYLPLNGHVLRIAMARSGKSEAQMCRIVDHVGPVIATSTRGEIYRKTALLRADKGSKCLVFNPGLVDNYKSDLQWSILTGCKNMQTAMRRARDLMGPIPSGDAGTWVQKAGDVLGPLLYSAAHKGFNMRAVQKMLANGDDLKGMWAKIKTWLVTDVPNGEFLIGNLEIFYTTNDRTRTSITNSLISALAWLSVPEIARLGDAPNANFNIRHDLVDDEATIYMLGGEEPGVAPLMRALMAEIVFQSAKIAETRGGSLSPTLLLALDEMTLTCPGPVDKWVRDMGGRGIVMDMVIQQRQQLDQVWGTSGREIIVGNSYVLFGAGCKSSEVLNDFTLLSGTRTELRETQDANGKVTSRSEVEVPVMSADKLASLDRGEAVIFGGPRVNVIRTPRLTTRKDYRRVTKASRRPSFAGRLDDESQAAQDEFEREFAR